MKLVMNLIFLFLLVSCATGTFDYKKPNKVDNRDNAKIIEKSLDKTWDTFVEKLSSSMYSIDHMNKESGFISINFSTNSPREYLDCGIYNVKFKNLRSDQDLTFNGADTGLHYNSYSNGNVHPITRNTKLSGKANIYFKKISPKKTQLKVNIRYILTVSGTQGYMTNNYSWASSPYLYSVNFSTGEVGLPDRGGDTPSCVSSGVLEGKFLDMI